MSRTVLTEVALRSMHSSPSGRLTHWDTVVKHFGVRITPAGAKTFIVLLGSGRRQSIGQYPTITLAQARDKAKRILAERTLGRHQASSISWQAAAEKFIEACRAKNRSRTHAEYERTLKRYFAFGSIRLSEISRQQIAQKLDKLNKTPSQRAHALVICKMFFRWAIASGYIDVDPTAAFKRSRQKRRARVLSDEELRCIWRACEQRNCEECAEPRSMPASFCTIVQLLMLTGQRRGEIAALQSSFFKDDVCTLPSELTKNGRDHSFPFAALSAAILSRSAETTGFLFPARGKDLRPFNGWSNSKAALDKASGVTNWTLHDLRRTFRTIHARIGTPPHIGERLINHINAVASDVAQIYDLHTYLPEMRKAVAAYESHLAVVVGLMMHHAASCGCAYRRRTVHSDPARRSDAGPVRAPECAPSHQARQDAPPSAG
jgi:integrase